MRQPDVGRGGVETLPALDPSLLEEPAILLGAAVVGALLVAGAVLWWRRRRQPARRLRRLLEGRDEVAILAHANPDPDAMGAALGVAGICEAVGTRPRLYYPGQIRHHQNRAFRTVLDVDIEEIERAGDIAEEAVVLVDHNEPRGFTGTDGVDPVAVIDHHPGEGTGSSFTDVRPEYGACATIVTEYVETLGLEEPVLDEGTATGLLFGIQSDTNRLTSGCTPAEFGACETLQPRIDEEKLERIATPSVSVESLETKARAITERDVENSFALSDVGAVGEVDAIPQAADELVRLEGVGAVVVMGDREGTLHLSGRSRDDRVDIGRALAEAVEEIPMAEAGGHARMGGGQVSIDHMEGIGPSTGLSREEFKRRVFDCLAGNT